MVNLTAALEKITGIAHRLDGPYLVCAEPGGEPYLAKWDEAILGARPTDAVLETADLEVAKEEACARIEAHRISLETAGVMISWPDGTKSKIQTRDERDWRNINGVAARGLARLMQGLAEDDWFRDADDKNHTLLPTQAVDMGYQAASAISAIAKVAQDAKDAIRSDTVTTTEQIAAAEAAVVWPVG